MVSVTNWPLEPGPQVTGCEGLRSLIYRRTQDGPSLRSCLGDHVTRMTGTRRESRVKWVTLPADPSREIYACGTLSSHGRFKVISLTWGLVMICFCDKHN